MYVYIHTHAYSHTHMHRLEAYPYSTTFNKYIFNIYYFRSLLVCVYIYSMCIYIYSESHSVVFDSLQPHGL